MSVIRINNAERIPMKPNKQDVAIYLCIFYNNCYGNQRAIFALFYFSIGTLSGEGPAGHWKEGFFPLAPKVGLS